MDLIEYKNKINSARHPWEYARFNVLKWFLKKKLKDKKNPIIFDIGCGDSFVLENIFKIYPDAILVGVDTAFTPEIIADQKLRINNSSLSFYNNIFEVPTNLKADCILLMDVIEHIEDDIGFLKAVSKCNFVDQNTFWFITVPAYQKLFCSHDVFLGHFRRYDNEQLIKHCEMGGLKKDECSYFFFLLLLPRYLQVKKEKKSSNTKATTGLVEWNGSKFKTGFITFILTIDFKFSRLLRFFNIRLTGLSNYIICRKPV